LGSAGWTVAPPGGRVPRAKSQTGVVPSLGCFRGSALSPGGPCPRFGLLPRKRTAAWRALSQFGLLPRRRSSGSVRLRSPAGARWSRQGLKGASRLGGRARPRWGAPCRGPRPRWGPLPGAPGPAPLGRPCPGPPGPAGTPPTGAPGPAGADPHAFDSLLPMAREGRTRRPWRSEVSIRSTLRCLWQDKVEHVVLGGAGAAQPPAHTLLTQPRPRQRNRNRPPNPSGLSVPYAALVRVACAPAYRSVRFRVSRRRGQSVSRQAPAGAAHGAPRPKRPSLLCRLGGGARPASLGYARRRKRFHLL
jgi:hypothetical protein